MLLALAYVLVLATVALLVPLAISTADRVDADVRSQARGQADVVAASAADLLERPIALRALVRRAAGSTGGRVIVVDRRGRLIADSEAGGLGESFTNRPEIARALRSQSDQRERRSRTLNERLLATAVPVVEGSRVIGAVRVTQNAAGVDHAVRRAWLGLGGIGALVLALGLGAGAVIAQQIARPVVRLESTARAVAEGDLAARAPVEGSAEQRALARTFNDMTSRVQRLVRSQREFVADASHQLRTPLTGLRLQIEDVQSRVDDGQRGELDRALHEVDRLSAIVTDLLELSRVGVRDVAGVPVDLIAVVGDAAVRWQPIAEERGQQLSVEAARGASVVASRADVDRAVDALVENALRYSPPGSTVTVAAHGRAIEVVDEGPGIGADEHDHVFERFHRGSAGRGGPPGTGLGLPIARELARRWGGDVRLGSARNGGTAARLTFHDGRSCGREKDG